MTSPSRIDPPGSTTARIPASASTCRPSANGKYASLAATAPLARSPLRTTAILAESTRLTWPMPTPTVAPPLASTIALDFAARQARQANARSARTSAGLGAGLELPGGRVVPRGVEAVGRLHQHAAVQLPPLECPARRFPA